MMQPLALPGAWMWSRWSDERSMFFNGYLLASEGGNVAFDPLPLEPDDARRIEALGGVATILLTNRDHERGAAGMRERFGARILCHRDEAASFQLRVDGVFDAGRPYRRTLRPHPAGEVLPGIIPIALSGAKTPGEVAFLLHDRRAAVVGDAIVGAPAGALAFLEDGKLADPMALALSLRALWLSQLDALLLCDGAPVFSEADAALGTLLETRGGPAVNRINLDELVFDGFDDAGGRYRGELAEIGLPIGARKLGYQIVRLPPGARFCPLHSHDKEEEVFYVLDGAPTIRTLRGSLELRPGDFMAFPTGDRGAHQVRNESAADCALLLFGANDPDEVAYYPDSQKVLVRRRRLMMREARIEYFEGE